MPDPTAPLTPICALGESAPRQSRMGALTLTENAGLGLASLALLRDAPAPDLGLSLPGPGGWCAGDGIAAFWTGPDQWILEYPGGAESDVAADLCARAPGCAVTEQTDGFVCIEVAGPAAEIVALMEKLVNIEPLKFGPGAATRTGLHHLSVFVIRRAEDRLAIMGPRSAAGTLWHSVSLAATRMEQAA